MGANGGSAPDPWSQFSAKTLFLRVPLLDWAAVKHGSKTEFRSGNAKGVTGFGSIQPPTPVVAYTIQAGGRYDRKLMVLTETWREPLGAISEESMKREGFYNMEAFRRYWSSRTQRRFRPLDNVYVYRLRAFTDDDFHKLGAQLIVRLYREHLDGLHIPYE